MPSHHFFLNQHTQYRFYIHCFCHTKQYDFVFHSVNVVMIQLFVALLFVADQVFFGY